MRIKQIINLERKICLILAVVFFFDVLSKGQFLKNMALAAPEILAVGRVNFSDDHTEPPFGSFVIIGHILQLHYGLTIINPCHRRDIPKTIHVQTIIPNSDANQAPLEASILKLNPTTGLALFVFVKSEWEPTPKWPDIARHPAGLKKHSSFEMITWKINSKKVLEHDNHEAKIIDYFPLGMEVKKVIGDNKIKFTPEELNFLKHSGSPAFDSNDDLIGLVSIFPAKAHAAETAFCHDHAGQIRLIPIHLALDVVDYFVGENESQTDLTQVINDLKKTVATLSELRGADTINNISDRPQKSRFVGNLLEELKDLPLSLELIVALIDVLEKPMTDENEKTILNIIKNAPVNDKLSEGKKYKEIGTHLPSVLDTLCLELNEPCVIALDILINNEFGYSKFQEFILDNGIEDAPRVKGFEIWKKQKKAKNCSEEDKDWLIQNKDPIETLINAEFNVNRICP